MLRAVRAAMVNNNATPQGGVSELQINQELGRGQDDTATHHALVYLEEGGYVRQVWSTGFAHGGFFVLAQRGREVVEGWPAGSGDALLSSLVAALDERIEAAPTEEERSDLKRIRDSFLGAARDVVVGVLTNLASRGAGVG